MRNYIFFFLVFVISISCSRNIKNEKKQYTFSANEKLGDIQPVNVQNYAVCKQTEIFNRPMYYYLNHNNYDSIEELHYPKVDYDFSYIVDYYHFKKDTMTLRNFKFNTPNHIINIRVLGNNNYQDVAVYYFVDGQQITHYEFYHSCSSFYDENKCYYFAGEGLISPAKLYISKDKRFLVIRKPNELSGIVKIFDLKKLKIATFWNDYQKQTY